MKKKKKILYITIIAYNLVNNTSLFIRKQTIIELYYCVKYMYNDGYFRDSEFVDRRRYLDSEEKYV
jgi:hypothetical protein